MCVCAFIYMNYVLSFMAINEKERAEAHAVSFNISSPNSSALMSRGYVWLYGHCNIF